MKFLRNEAYHRCEDSMLVFPFSCFHQKKKKNRKKVFLNGRNGLCIEQWLCFVQESLSLSDRHGEKQKASGRTRRARGSLSKKNKTKQKQKKKKLKPSLETNTLKEYQHEPWVDSLYTVNSSTSLLVIKSFQIRHSSLIEATKCDV